MTVGLCRLDVGYFYRGGGVGAYGTQVWEGPAECWDVWPPVTSGPQRITIPQVCDNDGRFDGSGGLQI